MRLSNDIGGQIGRDALKTQEYSETDSGTPRYEIRLHMPKLIYFMIT